MTIVVCEMVAVVLEGVVVLVLVFPAGAASLNDRFERIVGDPLVSAKAAMVDLRLGGRLGDGHLAEVDVQGVRTGAQGHVLQLGGLRQSAPNGEYYNAETGAGCGLGPFRDWSLLAHFVPYEEASETDITAM